MLARVFCSGRNSTGAKKTKKMFDPAIVLKKNEFPVLLLGFRKLSCILEAELVCKLNRYRFPSPTQSVYYLRYQL